MNATSPISSREMYRAWFPLWISWLAMALEFPVISAFVARLPHPEIALAAFGGVIIPIAFVIEAPIIMLLSASTALCRDGASYRKLFRIMLGLGGSLTMLHLLLTVSPAYFFVTTHLLDIPSEVIGAARTGLLLMLPWTWSIAYRRFNQGILIRFGKSSAVGYGTLLRLTVNTTVGALCLAFGSIPGAVVAAASIISGVIAESAFIGLLSRGVIRDRLLLEPPVLPPLTTAAFVRFYIPLALTSLMDFLTLPLCSASVARMPYALESLAVMPVTQGLSFAMRSPGFALTELVIANAERPGAHALLGTAARRMSLAGGFATLLLVATAAGQLLFTTLLGLTPVLAHFSRDGLALMLPLIVVASYKNFFQGLIVHSRNTRAVTTGTVVFILVAAGGLYRGVSSALLPGIHVMSLSLSVAALCQLAWLTYAATCRRASAK